MNIVELTRYQKYLFYNECIQCSLWYEYDRIECTTCIQCSLWYEYDRIGCTAVKCSMVNCIEHTTMLCMLTTCSVYTCNRVQCYILHYW